MRHPRPQTAVWREQAQMDFEQAENRLRKHNPPEIIHERHRAAAENFCRESAYAKQQ
ncbi:MAG: hypothetical protein GY862_17725 [Gammaproteobacteria bacterium]|nr:hypothetical protein [Gammaproteobacteria bacterium]